MLSVGRVERFRKQGRTVRRPRGVLVGTGVEKPATCGHGARGATEQLSRHRRCDARRHERACAAPARPAAGPHRTDDVPDSAARRAAPRARSAGFSTPVPTSTLAAVHGAALFAEPLDPPTLSMCFGGEQRSSAAAWLGSLRLRNYWRRACWPPSLAVAATAPALTPCAAPCLRLSARQLTDSPLGGKEGTALTRAQSWTASRARPRRTSACRCRRAGGREEDRGRRLSARDTVPREITPAVVCVPLPPHASTAGRPQVIEVCPTRRRCAAAASCRWPSSSKTCGARV